MANKKKAMHADIRREVVENHAKVIRRMHPTWTLQQVNDAAYRATDLQIKRGEVRVS